PVLWLARRSRMPREILPLIVLAATFVPLLLFAHPQQGVFRDWDVFAQAGVACSLVAAWLAAEAGSSWLLAPLALSAIVPTLLWLASAHDVERGVTRVLAFMAGPPARTSEEEAKTFEYVGLRRFRMRQWNEAAQAFDQSAARIP